MRTLLFIFAICTIPLVATADELQDGGAAYCGQHYQKAWELLMPRAENGSAEAQKDIGWMYQEALGAKQNDTEAFKWFHKSAALGNAEAQYHLGLMYYEGRGVKFDEDEADIWFRKSAEQGNVNAQFRVGKAYAGSSAKSNHLEAEKWFRKAADRGSGGARFELGILYLKGGYGLEQDYAEAYFWFAAALNGRGFDEETKRSHNYIKYIEEIFGTDHSDTDLSLDQQFQMRNCNGEISCAYAAAKHLTLVQRASEDKRVAEWLKLYPATPSTPVSESWHPPDCL